MNAKEYCNKVEQIDLLHKRLYPSIKVVDDKSALISLKDSDFNLIFEPSIMKDYKYLIREEVFEKIGRISKKLDMQDKRLIIRSVWRSFKHQRLLWENKVAFMKLKHPAKKTEEIEKLVSYFIAPENRSMHSTGGAVDALIYDLKEEKVMNFGTNDGLKIDLSKKCYPFHPGITPIAKKNRKLLIDLFQDEGFVCDLKEYWHFDYGNIIWAIEKKKNTALYGVIKKLK